MKTHVVGRKIVRADRVESTNDLAWREALDGAPNGTCIVAEEQTGGRGRFGRTWDSPRGTGLYLSAILRKPLEIDRVSLVTALGAIAVVEAIEESTDLKSRIRFPNDVIIGEKKVAGVLVEARFVATAPDLFILGIGLNVGQERFPAQLREIATSLKIESERDVDRGSVSRAVMESLDRWYAQLDGPIAPFRRFWKKHSSILGRRVRVREGGKDVTGTVEDVDPIDGVVLRLSHGQLRGFRGEHIEKLEQLGE